mgnify:CR=1 FL=1
MSPVDWIAARAARMSGGEDIHGRNAGLSKACFYGVMEAADAVDAPVIIQASRGARSYANDIMLARLIDALVETGVLSIRLKCNNSVSAWGEKNRYAVHVRTGLPIRFFVVELNTTALSPVSSPVPAIWSTPSRTNQSDPDESAMRSSTSRA